MQHLEIFENELRELFKDRKEALEFLLLFAGYGAVIDDLIDEEKTTQRIKTCCWLASEVFNCPYWNKYKGQLYILDKIVHNQYFDSVLWEKEPEEWKRQHAKVYSHAGMMMTLAVILIEFGEETMQKYSLKLREYAFLKHQKDPV